MADPYSTYAQAPGGPARNAAAVTPADGADLTTVAYSLYIGLGGDVTVNMANSGTTVLFKSVPTGAVLPIAVARVKATGTTATNIVALW